MPNAPQSSKTSILIITTLRTCLYGQRACHNSVNPVTERVKLLVTATQNIMLEQVARSAIVFKQGHVQLHGEI